jgi:hypothetical protein
MPLDVLQTREPNGTTAVLNSKEGRWRKQTMRKHNIWLAFAVALAGVGSANAQDNERALERLEVTMTLLPEQARDAAEITRRIELPPAAARGAESGAQPNELPTPPSDAAQQGLETAAEARERGRDFGQQVAEEARQNRENAGRGDALGPPDGIPTGPPSDLPSPPNDLPGPPANPGRP